MNDVSRPDPDALLAQLRNDEARALRGKLRIYFGASAGVGKTWAMLSAAQRERTTGRDVLIGVIETHGRRGTFVSSSLVVKGGLEKEAASFVQAARRLGYTVQEATRVVEEAWTS